MEHIQTHISHVFLLDRDVYKLKKSVRYDFLDFSTSALRAEACRNEVHVNRRLAPDIYKSVVPVYRGQRGKFQWEGVGEPVDYLVHMRRLHDHDALDYRIRKDLLDDRNIDDLGRFLATFYAQLPPVSSSTEHYVNRFEDLVGDNARELHRGIHRLDTEMVDRAHASQKRFLALFPEILANRVRDGRLIDGHGDLRPEHIYLTNPPRIIDAIEFDPAFRQVDAVDELGFLAMECRMLSAPWVGGVLLDAYCRETGDVPPASLVSFYMSYRACVRAKVMVLRALQSRTESERHRLRAQAGRYIELADRLARDLLPPLLIVVRGLSGSGKSTLASHLAESWQLEHLQTDRLRRNEPLIGEEVPASSFNMGRYSTDAREHVYRRMFDMASRELSRGRSVVLDATFLEAGWRHRAVTLARHFQAIPFVVHCVCPVELCQQRIRERLRTGSSLSEAKPGLVAFQRRHDQPDPAPLPGCEIDSSLGLPEILRELAEKLKKSIEGQGTGASPPGPSHGVAPPILAAPA